jgi:N-dimethylarginine dimethylaminohydrolase
MKSIHELFPPKTYPSFDSPEDFRALWGDVWGLNNDVGKIKKVLMKRPGKEITNTINENDCIYDEEFRSWVHKEKKGYWVSPDKSLPNLEVMQQQHDSLAQILKDEGAEVIYMDTNSNRVSSKVVYVRDVICVAPGGAIISRMAPAMRQGEEKYATKLLSEIEMPLIGSIIGNGLFEGGSLAFINPKVAVAGHSKRGNHEGISQLESILSVLGIELITIPLVGHSIHTDGAFTMIDKDKALVVTDKLPYWFLEKLSDLGIKMIEAEPGERWGINCLAVKPGRVIIAAEAEKTIERMVKEGVDVIPLDYSEVQKNGGGIHCSTNPLIRESI